MALGSCARQSPCINTSADPTGAQNKLAGHGPVQKFNAGSNKVSTNTLTPLEASTSPLVPFSTEDLFIKFMKVFMETTQAQPQALAKPRERLLKARSPET